MVREGEFVCPPLLTIAEAARHLGVGRKIVYRLIHEGRLTELKIQGSTRLKKRELDDFKQSGQLT